MAAPVFAPAAGPWLLAGLILSRSPSTVLLWRSSLWNHSTYLPEYTSARPPLMRPWTSVTGCVCNRRVSLALHQQQPTRSILYSPAQPYMRCHPWPARVVVARSASLLLHGNDDTLKEYLACAKVDMAVGGQSVPYVLTLRSLWMAPPRKRCGRGMLPHPLTRPHHHHPVSQPDPPELCRGGWKKKKSCCCQDHDQAGLPNPPPPWKVLLRYRAPRASRRRSPSTRHFWVKTAAQPPLCAGGLLLHLVVARLLKPEAKAILGHLKTMCPSQLCDFAPSWVSSPWNTTRRWHSDGWCTTSLRHHHPTYVSFWDL